MSMQENRQLATSSRGIFPSVQCCGKRGWKQTFLANKISYSVSRTLITHFNPRTRPENTSQAQTPASNKQTCLLEKFVLVLWWAGQTVGEGWGLGRKGRGYLHHGAWRPALRSASIHLLRLQDYPLKHLHSRLILFG